MDVILFQYNKATDAIYRNIVRCQTMTIW